MKKDTFKPWTPLFDGTARPGCRAVVIVPVRNEEASLADTLDALAAQVDLAGRPMPNDYFDVFLLLNNCTDGSSRVACDWKKQHPTVGLHIAERLLAHDEAFVGTARRMLMDTAWHWLQGHSGVHGVLSTDSDTLVRHDWVAQNMAALEAGAHAVGGVIALKPGELERLPQGARRAYLRDRQYQHLVAQLEDLLDPQDGDPWPRHLEHFGASLACTPEIYARAGGMPAVTPLEDIAFVDRLRRAGAKLRHHPKVTVFTSARLEGQVTVGLSGQLNLWQQMSERQEEHTVQSATWLAHRFRTLARLRKQATLEHVPAADYLAKVDCDRLVEESFRGSREGEITRVIRRLAAMVAGRR